MESKEGGELAKQPRTHFTLQYKLDMVRRIACREKTIADLARETGMHPSILSAWWRQRDRLEELRERYRRPQLSYVSELGRLKRAMKRVTAERDILKKARSYFAKRGRRGTNS